MPLREFLTVPEEVLECANRASDYFENYGYIVSIEKQNVEHPYTPTLLVKRGSTTILAEVVAEMKMERLREWVRFGRSCSRDTRVAAVIRPAAVSATDEAELRTMGVGLFECNQGEVLEKAPPKDLSVQVDLPDITLMPKKLKKALGPVYEEFERSHWREGFEDACQALEAEARAYLIRGMKGGRILLVDAKGQVRKRTPDQINKLTLGQLASEFGNIAKQTHADSVLAQVLQQVNKDRVAVAHHKKKATTETRLRRNVGRHMWSIVRAFRALYGLSE